jgi:hypothetical protein
MRIISADDTLSPDEMARWENTAQRGCWTGGATMSTLLANRHTLSETADARGEILAALFGNTITPNGLIGLA